MSSPYIGEIRLFSFNFPPKGWALCNGQLLSISQNQALFAILGTTYGGNGIQTFALPNLQGRVPVHVGNGVTLGQALGEAAHTLTEAEMPIHTHTLTGAAAAASTVSPSNNVPATGSGDIYATPGGATVPLAALSAAGGGQPHQNLQPYLTVSLCIALVGIFPSQN